MTRVKISRPTLSVPNQYSAEGGRCLARKFTTAPTCSGCGVIQGARSAARMARITMAAPITAGGLREKRYQFW